MNRCMLLIRYRKVKTEGPRSAYKGHTFLFETIQKDQKGFLE